MNNVCLWPTNRARDGIGNNLSALTVSYRLDCIQLNSDLSLNPSSESVTTFLIEIDQFGPYVLNSQRVFSIEGRQNQVVQIAQWRGRRDRNGHLPLGETSETTR